MARKQGRPPKDADAKKSAHINTRLAEDLKKKLEEASENNRRTLSQEIAVRLEESFQNRCADAFDGEENYAIFRLVALALFHLRVEMNGARWYESPTAYYFARKAVSGILDQFKPGTLNASDPKTLSDVEQSKIGERSAEQTLVWLEQHAGDYGKSLERLLALNPESPLARAKQAQNALFRDIAGTVVPLMQRAGTRKGFQSRRKSK